MGRRIIIITDHRRNSRAPADNMNWEAVTDNYDGPGSPIGYGATESEAVMNLYEQIADREDDDEERAEYEAGSWQPRDPDLALEQKRDDEMLDKLHR